MLDSALRCLCKEKQAERLVDASNSTFLSLT